MDARIYKKMMKNIIETDVRAWVKDKLKKAGINASVTIMTAQFAFEADGPFMAWSCPVILHGQADDLSEGAFVDVNVNGTIMDRVLIEGCQFLDDKKDLVGTYSTGQRIGRFIELYDECAI